MTESVATDNSDLADRILSKLLPSLLLLVIGWTALQCPTAVRADSCVKFYKRAPVKAVCGRVTDPAGERLNNVELTLTNRAGSVLFTTRSNRKGQFSFGATPKGDYKLHANLRDYIEVRRDVRVTRSNEKKCSPKIEVVLATSICACGTRVKGVDKPSDLDSESPK